MKLLHEDLTYKIRKCIYEVRNEIGSGFDEETYHQGLKLSFIQNDIPFVSKEKRSLMHRDKLIRNVINDFLLFDKIILSVKCIPCKFLQVHYVQLFSELKLWKKELGLLVNFGLPDLDIERYVFNEREPNFVENYEYIKYAVSEVEKRILAQIRNALKDVVSLHGLGYGKVIWQKIVKAELDYLGISFAKNRIVPVQFSGQTIRNYRLRHLIVEKSIILGIIALQDKINQLEVAHMQSYLKALGISIGIIVNFGKRDVHISGVRAPIK